MKTISLSQIDTIHAETKDLNVIVETARGSRTKFKHDPETGLFLLDKILPAGAVFPYDFGFFPSTIGEDGDPLDALVLTDEPLFPGCLVRARLIGAIEAEQTARGKTIRNDRLITVASESWEWRRIGELEDLATDLIDQIEHFFVSYNQMEAREFKPIRRAGSRTARKLLDEGIERVRDLSESLMAIQ